MDTVECRKVLDKTKNNLNKVRYNKDLNRLYKNLESMVENISKLEVECRQKKQYKKLEDPIKTFMESVDRLEKLILIAKLIE